MVEWNGGMDWNHEMDWNGIEEWKGGGADSKDPCTGTITHHCLLLKGRPGNRQRDTGSSFYLAIKSLCGDLLCVYLPQLGIIRIYGHYSAEFYQSPIINSWCIV